MVRNGDEVLEIEGEIEPDHENRFKVVWNE